MMCDHSGVYTNESTQGDQTLFVVEERSMGRPMQWTYSSVFLLSNRCFVDC